MSLYCDETGRYIEYGEPLKAATRNNVKFFSALSKEAIDKIPIAERYSLPRDAIHPHNPNEGVDIYDASSGYNPGGNYSLSEFRLKEFCFSISQETAEKYLPNHLNHYEESSSIKKKDRYQILRESLNT